MSRRGAVVAGSGQIGLTASMRALKFAGRPKSLARCDAGRGIAVRVRHRTSVVRRRLICTFPCAPQRRVGWSRSQNVNDHAPPHATGWHHELSLPTDTSEDERRRRRSLRSSPLGPA